VNLRQEGRVLRIGHRGAAALAPENTLASIEAAIECALDLVEIDVVAHANALRLAHSPAEVRDDSPALDEALALVARADAGVMLDLKSRGIERSAVETLREHQLLDRAVVASFHPASLRAVTEVEPALTTGFSYPFDRAGISERAAFAPLIRVGLSGLRRALPARIAGMLARAQADALVVHHALVSRTLVERCHSRDAAVLAWTIEDDAALARVLAAGVDGVIANDPRLLGD
jgi:glycerophosphoryl diester phosphodiesterase